MSDVSRSPLAERFKRRTGRRPVQDKNRIKTSIFIDSDVLERANKAWKDFNHANYPRETLKALYLEELIEYGLAHIEEVEAILSDQ
jgi:hypothetical protein